MRPMRLAVVLAMVLTLVGSGLAAGSAARPMTGRFTASVVTVAQRCGADALTIGFDITGVASHLGRLTGNGSNCTEFTLGTSAVSIWDGDATLTAADGSTVTTVAAGTQSAPIDGIASFAVTHTVTGGSGRMADASGVWFLTGTINFLTGMVDGTVDGWLSY
jgi:hypothetical protein